MNIKIPELALVALIGPSGCGKSTFASRHFLPTEVISSDKCRAMVSDDENDQSATKDAFELLHYLAGKRLARGNLTVIDATNVQQESRRMLVNLARQYHCLPVAIVFNLPEKLCHDRNATRTDRSFGPHVVRNQRREMQRSLRSLQREGFRHIFVMDSVEQVDAAGITRDPLYNNKKAETGPFDIIGDVHGCFDELVDLLSKLGYRIEPSQESYGYAVTPPPGRKVILLGDLVDRGPKVPDVLKLAMSMVQQGVALAVPGNHDQKLMRYLRGKNVKVTHGLQESVEQLEAESPEFRAEVEKFIDSLVSHYVLDGGRLVVAHAGMKEEMQGRGSGKVREFALYGETTGESDEYGLPIRYPWAKDYRGKAMVVYGHTPVPEPEWLNNTLCIDTGCVFGGSLTALRYPEKELVSVPARRVYSEPVRPLVAPPEEKRLTAQQVHDNYLHLQDVLGKFGVETRLHGRITVREGNSAAALEIMSRFGIDPRWLIYLPPTMSPPETSPLEGVLEHPAEAFDWYRKRGTTELICEEKHMGSRAVAIVCKDADAARRRFGVFDGSMGIIYTRTGRRFFNDAKLEQALLDEIANAASAAGLWDELSTEWLCLDCELMPWSVKAQDLIRTQYAAVAAAGAPAVAAARASVQAAMERNIDGRELLQGELRLLSGKLDSMAAFRNAYRRYCWAVNSPADLRIAPFHIMAAEGGVFTDKPHRWHLDLIGRLCEISAAGAMLFRTATRIVTPGDTSSEEGAVNWWTELTATGGEGMVVKPMEFTARGSRGLLQPAIKVRGKEYLRIIYGPDYDHPQNLARLKVRSTASKRRLALAEYALGVEALERFVAKEPLRRVHECVFAILAMESEPVDPRL